MKDIFIPNTRDKLVMNEPFETACNRSIQIRQAVDSPSGVGSGCGNVKGYLDSYGTMTTNGAFEETIEFLMQTGFLADGHGAAYGYRYPTGAEIGIFTDVKEDAEGLQLTWEYHDDPHSQTVRQKTEKRLKNGKTCGMSIGFYVGDGINPPCGWVYSPDEDQPDNIDYICVTPQYYDEVVPLYSLPEYGKENLIRAQQFYAVYILLRVHVFEVSQTEIPANEVSLIAEVRHKTKTIMAKREEDSRDAKLDAARDAHEDAMRAFKKAKESHEDHADHLDSMARSLRAMGRALKDAEEEDDDDAKKSKSADDDDGKRIARIYKGGR